MRKDYGKNNMCPYCGEFFNYLGLANHRARCREKQIGNKRKCDLPKNQRIKKERG